MTRIDPRTWLEQLSPRECWELLSTTSVGRLGVIVDSAPEIYPVNFAVDDRSIVFRTTAGSKLDGLVRSPSVCFEVDGFDTEANGGWSVLVKGRGETAGDRRHLDALDLMTWAPGVKSTWIRISARSVSGRRILDRPL